ncbi:unnamed protein product [Tetraodon nigroviridis]|uniref:(spotted green pufferfish) hypothetical protein n=1 Tax=Tetraodon nigroviridis TaxID=99883 RepID=Q4T4U3_TETNG|nr:unnamed protein product [Tetraodon nigroviridis]
MMASAERLQGQHGRRCFPFITGAEARRYKCHL